MNAQPKRPRNLRRHVKPITKERARRMRRNPTPAEAIAWSYLRNGRKQGRAGWHRQSILRGYIADFYCPKARLVLEVDGGYHRTPEQRAKDYRRDRVLRGMGIETLRIANHEVGSETIGLAISLAQSRANAQA